MRTLILLFCCIHVVSAADVLLTGYRPFAGRTVNGSETMVRWLGQQLGAQAQVEVMRCEWGEPEALVARVVTGHPWRAVIGLGEGWPGLINVEQHARNLREGADERGVQPAQRIIDDQGGDLWRGLRLDSAWLAGLPAPTADNDRLGGLTGVVLSANAGTYLCNNALYRYAQLREVPIVGFIHVPIQGAMADSDYLARYGETVRRIIVGNLAGTVAPTP